jgi:hypothetical protein
VIATLATATLPAGGLTATAAALAPALSTLAALATLPTLLLAVALSGIIRVRASH